MRPSDGRTAFHRACVNNHAACAEALARAGCDVGIKDPRGRTGLQVEFPFAVWSHAVLLLYGGQCGGMGYGYTITLSYYCTEGSVVE